MPDESLSDPDQSLADALQRPLKLDGLSYEEYFNRVADMIESVRQHWEGQQRVKSLKVVIQLSKLLADTSQIKLYGKKYKMITDLLDEFGRLVYARVHSLASEDVVVIDHQEAGSFRSGKPPERAHLSSSRPENGAERARDTCRNWFLKVASIRELVPRFYVEISIMKCCDILLRSRIDQPAPVGQQELLYSQYLMRLSKAAWGFGDPIVALHARVYLCKVANQLIGFHQGGSTAAGGDAHLFEIVRVNLRASIVVLAQLDSATLTRALRCQNVNVWSLFELLSAGLQFISNTIAHKDDLYTNEDELSDSAERLFETMLSDSLEVINLNEKCSLLATNIILSSIIRTMPASIIVNNHRRLLQTIRASYESWIEFRAVMDDELRQTFCTFYATLESFALALDASGKLDMIPMETRRDLFGFAKQTIDQLAPDQLPALHPRYIRCFKAWLSYASHQLSSIEVDSFLGQFVDLLNKRNELDQQQGIIVLELIKTLAAGKKCLQEFASVFNLRSFQSLLDLLNGHDDLRLEASRLIFETMRVELKLTSPKVNVVTGNSSNSNLELADNWRAGQSSSNNPLIGDKRMIEFMLKLFATINDSLGLLIADDDIVQLSQVIILFMQIMKHDDFFERLNFLTKCRGSLNNLNLVLEHITGESLKLATDYRKSERARSKRRNYLNACLAFAFITIPALNDPLAKLKLLERGARLALNYMSLSLADHYIKQILLHLTNLVMVEANTSGTGEVFCATTTNLSNNPKAADESAYESGQPAKRAPHLYAQVRPNADSKQLERQIESILNLMLEHRDYIDLRYKLALSDLIEESSLNNNYKHLLEQSKSLKAACEDKAT